MSLETVAENQAEVTHRWKGKNGRLSAAFTARDNDTQELPRMFAKKTLGDITKLKLIGWHTGRGSIVAHGEVRTSPATSKSPGSPSTRGQE